MELSSSGINEAKIGHAMVDLSLQVKREVVLMHYHCHGYGLNTGSGVFMLEQIVPGRNRTKFVKEKIVEEPKTNLLVLRSEIF